MAQRLTPLSVAYGAVFCVALPLALAAWAWRLEGLVPGTSFASWPLGVSGVVVGCVIMVVAWRTLMRAGDGLPMNACPTKRWVTTGVFRLLPHPIYIGFSIAIAGAAIAWGSFAAQAVVVPITIMGCFALWWGYERRATLERLGPRPDAPWLALSPDTGEPPKLRDLVSTWVVLLIPWAIVYEGVGHLPVPGAIDTWLSFERHAPVLVWTEWVYVLAYPLVAFTPLLCSTRSDVRRFQRAGIIAGVLGFWFYLGFPAITPPRPFVDDSLAGELLRMERSDGLDGRAALPSFHVAWALLCAWAIGRRGPIAAALAWTIGVAITISTWTTGMHGVLDILGGVALFGLAVSAGRIWQFMLQCAEANANGWHEWRIGRVRVLGYGAWPAIAALGGWLLIDGLTVGESRIELACISLGGLVGAAAWGQWLEASSRLARPFGYYGHLLGSLGGAMIATLLVEDAREFWMLLSAVATAAPWIQAIGRIRCLTQGCCHGRGTTRAGIVYHSQRSRVLTFSTLGHTPIHATQVYSMLGNVLIGVLLVRAWSASVDAALIVGGYFILSGLLRFVEEHYRGEPQTRVLWGMAVYQWLSVAGVLAGMALTCVRTPPVHVPIPAHLDGPAILWALAAALLYAVAMGVDMPDSNRRLGRLA